jgi:L,D-transpeptidase-like protein
VRALLVALGVVIGSFAVLAVAALFAWPRASLSAPEDALAHVSLPSFAGHVTAIRVRSADGTPVPVRVENGKLWPSVKLKPARRVTVDVTVKRPGWAGWLVGDTDTRTFTVATPAAPRLSGRWLQVKAGAPVTIGFDEPVSVVAFRTRPTQKFRTPSKTVRTGIVARGPRTSGTIVVAATARSWERLGRPVTVSWFPARPYPQVLAEPAPATRLLPSRPVRLTFSEPVRDVLGTQLPQLQPSTPGRWQHLDAHTLAFTPTRLGFPLGTSVRIRLPHSVHAAGTKGASLTRTLDWTVPPGSTLRLHQLLAREGYLPLDWQPTKPDPDSPQLELDAAVAPPAGRFTWRYGNVPNELSSQWNPDQITEITRGAVMMFEDDHELAVDAIAGRRVWQALIADALAGKRRTDGYSYVYVHRNVPQSLNLWHNGSVILSSPGNTGVPAAPTQLGTYPVFEHIPVGTMSGTNPDGSHYHDPGIQYISYFHGGDAIHAFNRASFGTPQSLGCVELPLDAAAKVWPYTPIGTLVTIED